MSKRILCLLLAIIMTALASSCATQNNNDTQSSTAAAVETTAVPADSETAFNPFATIPEGTNYSDYTFRFLNGNNGSWYTRTSIIADEQTGEPINDAIWERTRKVEEKLGVKIAEIKSTSITTDTRKSIQANTDDFDISLVNYMAVYPLAQENLFIDFKTIPNINLDADYWDQNAVHDMSVLNKLWFCTSDFDITRFDGIRSLYFNKELISMYNLENPYELVDNNKWTFDKYLEMAGSVVKDLDGDQKFTDKDRYGIVSYNEIIVDMLTCAGGFKYIDKDENDSFVIDIDNEKFYSAYEKIRKVLHDEGLMFDARSVPSSQLRGLGDRIQESIFLENGALFYSECMAWTRVLREMEADFGVLPPPKYDESQSRYYSVIINPYVMTVPKTTVDLERTGMVLEALSAASHDTVVTAYYDITLTGKVARDKDTVRMLGLVFDQLSYSIYLSNASIRNGLISKLSANSGEISSYLSSALKVYNKLVPKEMDKFAAIN